MAIGDLAHHERGPFVEFVRIGLRDKIRQVSGPNAFDLTAIFASHEALHNLLDQLPLAIFQLGKPVGVRL